MPGTTWLSLTDEERALICKALARLAAQDDGGEPSKLAEKIAGAKPHPEITVGVYGGVVQWVTGNPFPIRICDYDGEDDELPDRDQQGQRCNIELVEPDTA